MEWLKCRTCGHTFNSGFLKINYCPKCWRWYTQIGGIIKKLIILGIVAAVVMTILKYAAPGIRDKVTNTTLAAVDTTMLFSYSKDAYLESIIRGRLEDRFWTIHRTERPYYTSILPRARVEDAEPLGKLPAGVVVELRSAIRRGEHVWIPASFYAGEKLLHAFVLFPRDWEETVRVFDMEPRIAAIKTQYERFVRNNFKLMEVKPADEKEYIEKYNDYFKVKEIMRGENYFYAPKTDKAHIDKAYAYFLNPNNINMVILQTDKEWKRPDLVLTPAEEEK